MRSSPKRRNVLNRAGLVLLILLTLVSTGTVAWGHGTIAGGGAVSRVHTCVLPVGALRLPRVVADTDFCIPAVETGLDIPQNGTLIGVDIGPAVTMTIPTVANMQSPVIAANCPTPAAGLPPTHTVIGVTVSQNGDATLSTSNRISDVSWEVTFISPSGGSKAISVAPICMRLFQQM